MTDQVAQPGFPTRTEPEVTDTLHRRWVFRHPLVTRITHWINAICLAVLLMSGLQIFNAHPALYWGQASTFDHPFVSLGAADTDSDNPRGVTTVLGHRFDTTGVLGVSNDGQDQAAERGFPSWITLPGLQDLATGRRWHFFFAWLFVANGLVYLAYGLSTGQFRYRLIPTWDQWRGIGEVIREHLTLQFAHGDEAKRYNVLQKLAYLIVIAVLLPLQVLAGLAMSPGMDSVTPFLLTLFGGRQSARTIHFIIADLLVLFFIVHIVMVIVSGFANNIRSMVTGWFVIDREKRDVPSV
jgi:thiosulfate reductase cytochrome b subunit